MRKTVLIIKLGYCETLVNEEGFVPSLGDVFRHTVLLPHYANCHVTWLTSRSAYPLLRDNAYIDEILIYDDMAATALAEREFDEVLCLEKAAAICDMAMSVRTDTRLGFHRENGQVCAHPLSRDSLAIANGKEHFTTIQSLLYQMVGDYWRGEDYSLGYRPRPATSYDIGFNFRVGSKWPGKSWPMQSWRELESMCRAEGWSVSWQEGALDLEQYMDWVNAGRLIVTGDSLGMHLGLAMRKNVVALFGPTPSEMIHMYRRGVIIRADWACSHSPCMQSKCNNSNACMNAIAPEVVLSVIRRMLGTPPRKPAMKARILHLLERASATSLLPIFAAA